MAQLTEALSKRFLGRFGLPCLPGETVDSPEAAMAAAARLGPRVVVKAQIPAGRRGKAGGVLLVETPEAAANAFQRVTAVEIDGLRAVEALLEPRFDATAELYLAALIDPEAAGPVLLFGTQGGVDVEVTGGIRVIPLEPGGTVPGEVFRATGPGLPPAVFEGLPVVAQGLISALTELDARLAEVNPLAVGPRGELVALDARLVIDDHAFFRQPELRAAVREMQPRRVEDQVRDATRLEYVGLDGDIGLISGGAGMTMAVMDLIDELGGRPACFLDCSANPTLDGYGAALNLLLEDARVRAILISIFGGLTQMDRVARTLVTLLNDRRPVKPVTLRLMGTNADEADRILVEAGLVNHQRLEDAVAAAVASARGVEGVA